MTITPAVKCLVRACSAAAISAYDLVPVHQVIAREWSDDSNTQWLARAATSPMDMGNTPALVQTVIPDFVAALAGESAAARVFREGLQLSFDNAGYIGVPTLIGNPNYAAFVGEGDPIPVVQGFVEPLAMLMPKKIAAIIVLTAEMIKSSNIEALMMDAMIRSTALALDRVLFDDQPEDDVRPAGLRYGIAPSAASSAPNALDALIADVQTLYEAIEALTSRTPIFIVSPARTLAANLRTTRTLPNAFGSAALAGTTEMIAVAPNVIASVVGALPQISAKRGAVSVHANSAPLALVAGGTVATPQRSTWQADCVAVKVRWPVSWVLRSNRGVSWMTTINW
jgi:hypothetical protein